MDDVVREGKRDGRLVVEGLLLEEAGKRFHQEDVQLGVEAEAAGCRWVKTACSRNRQRPPLG